MNEESPFKDISKKIRTIDLEGKQLKVKPNVKDAELFITLRDEPNEKDAENISGVIRGIIRRAYAPEELSDNDIESIMTLYYGKLLGELSILFGFTTREEFEKAKKGFFTERVLKKQ